jgi:hypothetical protein
MTALPLDILNWESFGKPPKNILGPLSYAAYMVCIAFFKNKQLYQIFTKSLPELESCSTGVPAPLLLHMYCH